MPLVFTQEDFLVFYRCFKGTGYLPNDSDQLVEMFVTNL